MNFSRCVFVRTYGISSVAFALAIVTGMTVATAIAGTSAPAYSLTDLGALPPAHAANPSYSTATAINDAGQVVGFSNTASAALGATVQHAFISNGGGILDLGTPNGIADSTVAAINANGTIAGVADFGIGDTAFAITYSNGTFQNLGITSPNFASAINNGGQVVGTISVPVANTGSQAFIYSNGTVQKLGTLGGLTSNASGINNAGQVVGTITGPSNNSTLYSVAFLYVNGTVQQLGTLGGLSSSASAINDSGQVVGNSDTGSATHAFLYTGGAMQDLGTLPGLTASEALAINNLGEIVGDSSDGATNKTAFLYENGTMFNLNSLITNLQGDTVLYASGINSSGQIAASVMTPTGNTHAVLLTVVPLPAAAWAGLTMLPLVLLGKRIVRVLQ